MQTCNSIATIFGTSEERVTADSRNKFVVNLSNIQGVIIVYSRKKRSKFCHSYRVNQVSRHTVVCRAAQEAGAPHREYIDRKKMSFSHLCISVIPYPIGIKLATELSDSQGSLHSKCEGNRSSNFRDTSCQSFDFFFVFFSSSRFRTLAKIAIKRKRVLRSP